MRQLITQLFEWFLQLVAAHNNWVLTLVRGVFIWYYEAIVELRDLAWQTLVSSIPGAENALATLVPFLQFVDYFIDVQLIAASTSSMLAFLAVWTVYKHTKSYIPLISGS